MSGDYTPLIRQRAAEKRERDRLREGERTNIVPFALWLKLTNPELVPLWDRLTSGQRGRLYQEYQSHMIEMGYTEWQRARTVPGVSPWYDLF